jgi:hypothetical protein
MYPRSLATPGAMSICPERFPIDVRRHSPGSFVYAIRV